jgi:hypothetical protein
MEQLQHRCDEFHKKDCNCSEALLHGFRGQLPFPLSDETMRIATCFGGGKALQIYEYKSPQQKENCGRIIVQTGNLLAAFLVEKNLLPAKPQAK